MIDQVAKLDEEIIAAAESGEWSRASELGAARDAFIRRHTARLSADQWQQLADRDANLRRSIKTLQDRVSTDIAALQNGQRAVSAYRDAATR